LQWINRITGIIFILISFKIIFDLITSNHWRNTFRFTTTQL
jgi:hypothetical protein